MHTVRNAQGFTLIELLVVIAIIGMLASIVLVSVQNVRVKARDARRSADLKNFETALELYVSTNGHYPYTNGWTSFDSAAYAGNQLYSGPSGTGSTIGTLTQVMAPYITQMSDPLPPGGGGGYLYINMRTAYDYCILFWLGPENLNNFPNSFIPPNRCSAWDSNGQCTSSGGRNAIYYGMGSYYGGC